MIYGYMLESKKSVQETSIDSIINEEFSTFNRICDSINILTENGIIFEADGEGFFAKVKKIWENFKTWFNEKVIGFFKELFKKIVDSKLGQAIANLKSKRSEKLKNTKFSSDPEKPSEESADEMVGESVIMEAGRATQLKRIVEKNICPELFFKLTNYCDVAKLQKLSKEGVDLMTKLLEMTVRLNSKSEKSAEKDVANAFSNDPEVQQLYERTTDFYNEYDSVWRGPAHVGTVTDNFEEVKKAILADCEQEMKGMKSISFDGLVALIEMNIKNSNNEIKMLESVLKDTNKVISNTEAIIAKSSTEVTKFTAKCLKASLDMSKTTAKVDQVIIQFVNDTYSKSAKLLASMKALNDLVL